MTTGIQSAGQDLDTLLMPIGAHTPISAVHITSNGGVDLSQRFAGAAFGTPYGTTHIQSAGTDIGTLFARIASGPTGITLTAGHFSPVAGVNDFGFISGTIGSVSPTTIDGYTIGQLFTTVDANTNQYADTFAIAAATDPGATLFTTLAVSGGGTRTFASATYVYGSGAATWSWSGTPDTGGLFNATGSYSVTIS